MLAVLLRAFSCVIRCAASCRRRRRHHRHRPSTILAIFVAYRAHHLRFITIPFSSNFVFHRRWQPTTTWIQSALTDDEFLDRGDRICILPRFHAREKKFCSRMRQCDFHYLLKRIICRKYIINIFFCQSKLNGISSRNYVLIKIWDCIQYILL